MVKETLDLDENYMRCTLRIGSLKRMDWNLVQDLKQTHQLESEGPIRKLFSIKIGRNEHRLAATDKEIYDFSKISKVRVLKTDCLSGKWRSVSFLNHLIMVNGQDMPITYDGESIKPLDLSVKGNEFSEIITLP